MASFGFRATRYWRSVLNNGGLKERSLATLTHPKLAGAATATVDAIHPPVTTNRSKHGEWVPIYMLGGFVMIVGMVGVHTSTQHLVRSPAVQVTKKKREMVPEVDNPDAVLISADKFVDKSFLRKVAHLQEPRDIIPTDPIPNIYTRSRDIESLKTVGVAPAAARH